MAEPFQLNPRQTSFDPEFIEVLASAFDEAWNRIEKSGSRFARPGYARAMREVIAKRIIDTAQRGVKDQTALTDDAIQFLAANYQENDPAWAKHLSRAKPLKSSKNHWQRTYL